MSSRLYFVNDIPSAVRDNLEGLVTVNSHLIIHKTSNIVLRKDFGESVLSKRKVALISGGGSGHEPSHAGFVGRGLLTASVSGNIFASPTTDEVLRTIKIVNPIGQNSETLLIVPNYTGDRIHFGLAKEKAIALGFKVDIFVFGDDCVFRSTGGKAGGSRGLAGVFFIHKIAGALAESKSDLRSIKTYLQSISDRIASISISLGPCNVPGVGPSFVMPSGQLEVGLGIHGERGSDRVSYIPANEAVALLIGRLTSEDAGLSEYFLPDRSTRIVLLFNDNGGLTTMEMNIIIRETVSQLTSQGFTIERTYSGRYVTSFDMVGICISMMVVNDEILAHLDAPCYSAIIAQGSSLSRQLNDPSRLIIEDHGRYESSLSCYESVADRLTEDETIFIKCVSAACKVLIDNESDLNRLDSESGDSDCGSTLAVGARKILSTIESGKFVASFLQLAHIIESCMGGTSGALFSLFFNEASNVVESMRSVNPVLGLSMQSWLPIIKRSCSKMTLYSYAEPGDRTLVDPLTALIKALENFLASTEPTASVLTAIIDEVKLSAESTASMVAKIGRASYTPIQPYQGPDPGAWAIYLIVEKVICTYIQSN